MRIAAQLVRSKEEGAIGSSLPDVRRYTIANERSAPPPSTRDLPFSYPRAAPARFGDAARDDTAEAGANDFLPVLLGTENLASATGAWFIIVFHCDARKNPRVHLIAADSMPVAGRLVPTGVPVCAVPAAAIAGWTAARRVGEMGGCTIEPGSYFLSPRLEDLCRMFTQLPAGPVSSQVYRTVKLHELVCETIDAFVRDELVAADGDVRLPATDREQLNLARHVIVTRYADKLTIGQIARAAGIGRAKLIRGFRELYGCTVHDMITSTRLRVAAASLRATRQPVSRIAFESGYHSSAAFARAFSKFYGASPSAFRDVE